MFWKITPIIVFFIVTAAIGIISRKAVKSTDDFVLGGRNVGPWLSAFAYGTSYFSATIFVGYAGQYGYKFGASAFWIGIGNALIGSLLAWLVLGRRTRIMTKHLSASTMPEFFEKRFGGNTVKVIASVIIFIFLVPYSASVYKGLSGLFATAFGIDFIWCILGMAVLTGVFVVVGGYMGTAINNFIQGIIMLVGIVMILTGVLKVNGGLTGSLSALSQFSDPAVPEFKGVFSSMLGPAPLELLSVILLTSFGTWGLPQMVHKFYAIRDEKAIRTGTLISTVFAIIIAGGCYFMGGFGRLFSGAEEFAANGKFDELVPNMLKTALPDYLIGIVLLVVFAASISTLASIVLNCASTFISDFCKTLGGGKMKEKTELVLIRVLCAVFIVVSVLIAVIPNGLITNLMNLSWGALAGAFIGPFIYGLYWKRTTKAAVFASFLTGVGIVVVNFFTKSVSGAVAGALAMAVSMVIVPLVSILCPKPDAELVNSSFACYGDLVTVEHKEALTGKE